MSYFDETVKIFKILQIILDAAFPAYGTAASVAGTDAYCLMYPDERPEFLSITAGTLWEELGYIKKYKYCNKREKQKHVPMHDISPVYRYLPMAGFMQE